MTQPMSRPEAAEQWDQRWCQIYDDARADGCNSLTASSIADRETVEQFGPRPEGTP